MSKRLFALHPWEQSRLSFELQRCIDLATAVKAIAGALVVLQGIRDDSPCPTCGPGHKKLCSGYTVAGLYRALEVLGDNISDHQDDMRELLDKAADNRDGEV